jgi:hypothetical protein
VPDPSSAIPPHDHHPAHDGAATGALIGSSSTGRCLPDVAVSANGDVRQALAGALPHRGGRLELVGLKLTTDKFRHGA